MSNSNYIIATPEERRSELLKVLKDVRRKVKRYKEAKRKGTLKKIEDDSGDFLFNN